MVEKQELMEQYRRTEGTREIVNLCHDLIASAQFQGVHAQKVVLAMDWLKKMAEQLQVESLQMREKLPQQQQPEPATS